MRSFRRLCLTGLLTAAFTIPVLAGDISSPGAASPGQTDTPPCADPGETSAPPCLAPGQTQGPSLTAPGILADLVLELFF